MSEVPGDIREAVAIANLKTVAEQPAMLANLAYSNLIANINLSQQNAVSNQHAMNQLTLTITSKAVGKISNINPTEAAVIKNSQATSQLADQIAKLRCVLEKKLIV